MELLHPPTRASAALLVSLTRFCGAFGTQQRSGETPGLPNPGGRSSHDATCVAQHRATAPGARRARTLLLRRSQLFLPPTAGRVGNSCHKRVLVRSAPSPSARMFTAERLLTVRDAEPARSDRLEAWLGREREAKVTGAARAFMTAIVGLQRLRGCSSCLQRPWWGGAPRPLPLPVQRHREKVRPSTARCAAGSRLSGRRA